MVAPQVPAAAERRLVANAAAGDPEARRRLVETYTPAMGAVARRYRGSPGVQRRELMQEGVVGLLRALERYDATRRVPFWAYASWWVRQAMQDLVAELTRPVVLSDRALRQLARIKDARRDHLQAAGSEPSTRDLAAATGLTRAQIDRLVSVDRAPRGLAEPLAGSEEGSSTAGELIRDERSEADYELVHRQMAVDALRKLPHRLTERESGILRRRFGIGGCREQTLQEIAGRLDLSAERVRQLEQRALEKLRAEACEDGWACVPV